MTLDGIVSSAWKTVRRKVSDAAADSYYWLKEKSTPVRKKIGWATFGALSVGSLDYHTQKNFHKKHGLWEETSFWLGMAIGNAKKYMMWRGSQYLSTGIADSMGLYFGLTIASDIARTGVRLITGKVQPAYFGMWTPVAAAISLVRRTPGLRHVVSEYWPSVAKQAYKLRDYSIERLYRAGDTFKETYRNLMYRPRYAYA